MLFNQNFNDFDMQEFSTNLKHSKSDYEAFKSVFDIDPRSQDTMITKQSFYNYTSSRTLENLYSESLKDDYNSLLDTNDVFNTQNPKTISYSSLYPHVEIVNNNQIYNKSPPSSPLQHPTQHQPSSPPSLHSYVPYAPLTPLTPLTPQDNFNLNNNYNNNYYNNHNNNPQYYNQTINNNHNNNLNNNPSYNITPTTATTSTLGNAAHNNNKKSFGPNYSHALSASLASTPGVTIIPLNSQTNSASNLFNYGFYDSTNDFNNTQCKLEVSITLKKHLNQFFYFIITFYIIFFIFVVVCLLVILYIFKNYYKLLFIPLFIFIFFFMFKFVIDLLLLITVFLYVYEKIKCKQLFCEPYQLEGFFFLSDDVVRNLEFCRCSI